MTDTPRAPIDRFRSAVGTLSYALGNSGAGLAKLTPEKIDELHADMEAGRAWLDEVIARRDARLRAEREAGSA